LPIGGACVLSADTDQGLKIKLLDGELHVFRPKRQSHHQGTRHAAAAVETAMEASKLSEWKSPAKNC